MSATTTKRPRVLLLDDDPESLRHLALALEARGLEVRAATDAAAGLDLLLDELLELDALVADAELPGRDAASMVHLVRRAGGERDLALVVLASGAAPAAGAELLAGGADAVVDRALGPEATASVIAAVVVGRAGRREWDGAAEAAAPRRPRVVSGGAFAPGSRLAA